MEFDGFDWDGGNRRHCRKHGISRKTIESLFSGEIYVLPDMDHSQTEQRFRAIGRTTAGRSVFVVFTLRERDAETPIRPLSARYMHAKEVNSYESKSSGL